MMSDKITNIRRRLAMRVKLGDKVASLAQPIAGAIDGALKTNIKGCSACKKRRAWLNGE